jgi:superfamily II DNA or RNA helicase
VIVLRPYQSDGVQKIRDAFASGSRAPLYVLPTGGGKTVLFSAIAESSERRGKRVLILAHRVELVDQIVAALKSFNVTPSVIAAGFMTRTSSTHHAVAVASVQTLVRRLDKYPTPTLIVCDEAHHCAGGNSWAQILRAYSDARVLGVTATPARLDGRGLGAHFDKLIVGPSVSELTIQGYLAPARVFAPPTVDTSGLHIRAGDFKHEESESLMDTPSITGDALSHYTKHAADKPALVFCTSVAHAHHVAERFRKDGIAAVALDGGTDREIRRMAVQDFRDGKIRVLAACDLFSEGFDVPSVHVGIMLRPTASEGLWRQQVGRILRPSAGKSHAIILDHVNGTSRFGLPDEPREWELTTDVIRRKKTPAPGIRVCPKCFAASPARATACIECGTPFETKPRQEIEEKDGELVELTAEEIAKKRERREQGRSRTLAELEQFAKIRGYEKEWAAHVWRAREAKKLQKESA